MSTSTTNAPIEHLDVEQRAAIGRSARAAVRRSSHAEWAPPTDRQDPFALLSSQETTRVEELVPLRHERMMVSPFTFYRGAAVLMAADLGSQPDSGLRVQACGDAHLSNFGGFASPERALQFDINDFDETSHGPFEWDVKRLVTSFEIAARSLSFTEKETRAIVTTVVRCYRDAMAQFAPMTNLDVWYARLDVEKVFDEYRRQATPEEIKRFERNLAKAQSKDNLKAFAKLTEQVDGQFRIKSDPPLLMSLSDLFDDEGENDLRAWLAERLRSYRKSLQPDRRHLLESYRMVDFGRKVVGVGSVGTRCWITLMLGRDDADPLFLQIKEAEASVLEPYAGGSGFANHGQRVVEGQRLLQTSSDIMLGWIRTEGLDGVERDYYVRQLWDWKFSADIDAMTPAALAIYARLCGWTLARGHTRSGDRVAIAAYLGSGESFDKAISEFAMAYADQNDRDYETVAAALKDTAEGSAAKLTTTHLWEGIVAVTSALSWVLAVNPVPWARAQMAFTLAFHIILVPLGVAWGAITLVANYRAIKKNDADALVLAQRWSKYMAVTFAVGAVTGTVLSFEFGLLWPRFMGRFGDAFGIPFAIEGLFFFLEAIFLAVYIYGWKRLKPWPHFWTGVPIVIAGIGGTVSVVAANAWMNEPAGFTLNSAGKVVDVDPWDVIFNKAMPLQSLHMLIAAYLVGGFLVASVYAFGMLRGRRDRYHRIGFLIPFTVAAIAMPIQMLVGDEMARWVYNNEPVKFAAIEMVPKTSTDVPETLFGHLNDQGEVVGGIAIPGLASILSDPADGTSTQIQGLESFPKDERPTNAQVDVVHLAWDVMVGLGTFLFLLSLWYFASWVFKRRMPKSKLFLWIAASAGVLSVVTLEAGWVVTEVGRQPWIVRNYMKVEQAATANTGVWATFIAVLCIYAGLGITLVLVLRQMSRRWRDGDAEAEVDEGGPYGPRPTPDGTSSGEPLEVVT